MLFHVDPNPAETYRACMALTATGFPKTQGMIPMMGIFLAVTVAAFLLTPSTFALTTILCWTAVFAGTLALQASVRTQTRRLLDSDPHALETHHIELGPEGLRTWCDHVDSQYKWNKPMRVIENPEFFMFLLGPGTGIAIPKRLVDGNQAQELRDRIREWSPDRGASLLVNAP